MRPIYVTGHRNPDTDSIASAIGYAELRNKLDEDETYIPVRLGELNQQTRWVLERAGCKEPRHLAHVHVRVRDVMREEFPLAGVDDPVREVGLTMAQEGLDLVPVAGEDGKLAGVISERALARRYIRESREASSLVDAPTKIASIVAALSGELLTGRDDVRVNGRVWVFASEAGWSDSGIREGDVVVVGNREDAQCRAIDERVGLLVVSNDVRPTDKVLERAREKDVAIVLSPLDSYVCGRMVTLAAPCRVLMDDEPLTVRPDDLLEDVATTVKEVHYRAAIAVDREGHPIGLVTRTDLVNPEPRRVLLVDHAEQGQSVPGIGEAEIVEILDHHHIGSIETHKPVRATFDPVGSTSTLVMERFRQARCEPTRETATLLLSAILSDTVILSSPTTTRRDSAAAGHLARMLDVDPEAFGREMFEEGSGIDEATADELVHRDAKEYEVGDDVVCIAQVETVGDALEPRLEELQDALQTMHQRNGYAMTALMVTDILAKGTKLLVVGDVAPIERAFDTNGAPKGVYDLPGVMSRKKQVAPKLLAAF